MLQHNQYPHAFSIYSVEGNPELYESIDVTKYQFRKKPPAGQLVKRLREMMPFHLTAERPLLSAGDAVVLRQPEVHETDLQTAVLLGQYLGSYYLLLSVYATYHFL